jgi:AraC-like DNA-binding protein
MHSQASGSSTRHGTADPLAAVIGLLRPQTVLSKVVSGAGRWSVRYGAHQEPSFCLMLEGSCFLDADGAGALELQQGDFLLLPTTPGFVLASELGLEPKLVTPTYAEEVRHGKKGVSPAMRMLGGFFRFDQANAGLLVKFLPSVVHVHRDEAGATRLRSLVELIGDETTVRRPGRELILERLVEVLLLEALRFRPAKAARETRGLLAGLADPGLGRALRCLHADVARPWTVAELARSAGMSRAVFAERFVRKVGMPPMQYLLEWRIAIAKDVLRRERAPLAEVAELIGYQSASAFSTAFSRHTGCAPSEFARGGSTQPQAAGEA